MAPLNDPPPTTLLTFIDNQVCENHDHGVTRVHEVSAVHLVAVDGEPEPREHEGHSPENQGDADLGRVQLGGAEIAGVGFGQEGDKDGDGSVAIQQGHCHHDSSTNY